MNIWSNFVQSLMLSDDLASLKLCYYLMEDRKAICSWYSLSNPNKFSSLPALGYNDEFLDFLDDEWPALYSEEMEGYLKELERKRKNR